MFSFEGNFKSRRSINLGGTSKRTGQDSKDALIRQRQLERQQREEERQREQAAAVIQVGIDDDHVI
jgi:hypothetical protein